MSQERINISDYIPYGYANRVSREHLRLVTGLTDRDIRSAIEHSDAPVVNVDNGYFIPCGNDEQDVSYMKRYVRRETERCLSIMKKLTKYKVAN